MTPNYVFLLFCAFVAAMNDREPVHNLNAVNKEVWKKLATEEEHVLKTLDEKFNENIEKFDAEMKKTLKSLTAEDPNKVFNDLVTKCKSDVLVKTFKNYGTMEPLKLDYEKIAMQAVQNYYNFWWYFFLKRNHQGTSAKAYFFKTMWPFLDAGHRDFGPDYSVPYYKPPLLNRSEPLKLFKNIESQSPKKCDALIQERFVNWAVYRYLKQNDSKRLKSLNDSLAEALEKRDDEFAVKGISITDAKMDFGGNFPVYEPAFEKELEATLKTFIQRLNVQVNYISFYSDRIQVKLKR